MTLLLCLVQGFLSLFSLVRLLQLKTSNPITIILFSALCFVYYQFTKNQVECRIRLKDRWCSVFLSIIFTGIVLLAKYPILVLNSQFVAERIIICALTFIGLFLIFFYTLLWLFISCSEISINKNLYPVSSLPVLTFIGSIIVFGIYFLIEFPGLLTELTLTQFEAINGQIPFNDNVSLVHTVLLDKLYKLFYLIVKDSSISLAMLTVVQIIIVSFVIAYIIRTLQKAHIHSTICIIAVVYFLIPYHALMAVTLSANTLFAASLAGYTSVLIRLFLKSDQRSYSKVKWCSIVLPMFIFGFLLCTLSLTGLIVFLGSLPFVLITLKEKWPAVIFTSLAIILLVIFIKFPFMHIYEIPRKTFAESISPLLLEIFSKEREASVLMLLKQFFQDSLIYFYPSDMISVLSENIAPSGLLQVPSFLLETLFTMQLCIPLYGLLFSAGITFWILLISIFLCIITEHLENISLLLPAFIFSLTLCVMPPLYMEFGVVYPLFISLPLILFIPFIDAESEY